MTYNEYLKAVRDRYLRIVSEEGAKDAFLCESSLYVAMVHGSRHHNRLSEAIERELKGRAVLSQIWRLEGRYGIIPPKGRKDTHRKRLKRIVAARLQWLALQAD